MLDKYQEQHADIILEELHDKQGIDLTLDMVEYIVTRFVQIATISEVTRLEEFVIKATTGYKQMIEEGKS